MRGIRRSWPSEERAGNPDWQVMARQALGLRRDQLDFEAWRKARDASEGEWGELDAILRSRGRSQKLELPGGRDRKSRSLYSPDGWSLLQSSGRSCVTATVEEREEALARIADEIRGLYALRAAQDADEVGAGRGAGRRAHHADRRSAGLERGSAGAAVRWGGGQVSARNFWRARG